MNVVQVSKLEDLLVELRDLRRFVANNTVRWEIISAPLQDAEIDWEVGVWITAIINDETPYLLELGLMCGHDCKGEHADGTDQAEKSRQKVAFACDELKLNFRPGKIEVF
jgi:hypothetical protein